MGAIGTITIDKIQRVYHISGDSRLRATLLPLIRDPPIPEIAQIRRKSCLTGGPAPVIAKFATDPEKMVIDSRGEESIRLRKQEEVFQLALKIKEILLDGLEAELVALALFGSAARGTLRVGSDLDFLVVLRNPPRSYPKRTRIVLPFWARIQDTKEYAALERLRRRREPSFLILSADELKEHPPVLVDMVEEAIILCDPEACLQRELEALGQKLKALGSIKKRLPDGSWYWVLKPDIQAGEVIEL